jgi:hypothetical protein
MLTISEIDSNVVGSCKVSSLFISCLGHKFAKTYHDIVQSSIETRQPMEAESNNQKKIWTSQFTAKMIDL